MSAALKITGLSAGYSGFRILDGLDLDLAAGRITAIVGSNGAGKSTLLKALAGLLPRDGHAALDGHMLPPGSATAAVRAGLILVADIDSHRIVIGIGADWSTRLGLAA